MKVNPALLLGGAARIGFVMVLALVSCGQAEKQSDARTPERTDQASLLLITIDTWRWDHIGVSGEGKVETPNLDRLAREGVYEREAVTPCPLTTPAHASLFTGLNPSAHGVLDCTSFSLPTDIPTLAESFRNMGYSTAAFVSGETVKARYGLDRGFEVYDDAGMNSRGHADWQPASRDGEQVTDSALAHLARLEGDAPVFLWVHFFDAHLPYRGHEPFASRYPGRPYAAEVAYVDAHVGRLVEGLSRAARGWRIVIAGDHGEGLGDHGEAEHGYGLYRSTIHVPLILHPIPEPPILHARPWGLVDLFPTLQSWFGLPGEIRFDGEILFEEGTPERVLPTLTLLPSFSFGVQPTLGARQGNFNYVKHRQDELYDLSKDPQEAANLVGDRLHRDAFKLLRRTAVAATSSTTQESLNRAYRPPSEEELRVLASLGYLSGGVRIEGLPAADLHKLLRESAALDRERERAFATGELGALRERFGRLSREYPQSAFFLKNFATLSLRVEDFRAAAGAYEQAVRLDPKDSESMTNWGTACLKLRQYTDAQALLEGALKVNERDSLAHKSLAVLYGRHLGRPADALRHLERYLELNPNAPDRPAVESWAAELKQKGTVGQ